MLESPRSSDLSGWKRCPACQKASLSLTIRELWRSYFGEEEGDFCDLNGECVTVVDEAADYCRSCRNIDRQLGTYRYNLLMSMSAPRAFQDYQARHSSSASSRKRSYIRSAFGGTGFSGFVSDPFILLQAAAMFI